jgi:hypothetical protein
MACRKPSPPLLSPAFHPGSHLAHSQDFDIPLGAASNQPIQDVFEHGKTVPRFGQILRMKAEVEDPSMASRGR